MDLPLIITIVCIAFASFISFSSNLISALSQDDIDEIIEKELPNARKLQKQWIRFDEAFNPFMLVETILYSIAFFSFGISDYLETDGALSLLLGFLLIASVILAFRFLSFFLGIKLSKSVAIKFVSLYELFYAVLSPFESFYDKIAQKISGKNAEDFSREEITALFESAKDEGSLDDDEYRILKNIMNYSEVLVTDVMTPRTVMITLRADQTIGEVQDMAELSQYSRVPVWSQDKEQEEIIGYVLSKDIFLTALKGNKDNPISSITRELNLINENTRLDKALEEFLRRKRHMFVVVDEYGGVEGLITMEDVLETILGVEIIDEGDKVADLRVLAKQQRDKRISRTRD
jgi:CBS domain containing-hemolysin-like protein